jgi:hypothetical protein
MQGNTLNCSVPEANVGQVCKREHISPLGDVYIYICGNQIQRGEMGCKCCRWPVNACKMARMVKLLPLSFTGLVLFLTVHSFYNDALITGTLLLILFFPVFDFPQRKPLKLPPGPSGVPVLGYLPFLGENPHQEMAKLARKYGPLVHIQLGSFPG